MASTPSIFQTIILLQWSISTFAIDFFRIHFYIRLTTRGNWVDVNPFFDDNFNQTLCTDFVERGWINEKKRVLKLFFLSARSMMDYNTMNVNYEKKGKNYKMSTFIAES